MGAFFSFKGDLFLGILCPVARSQDENIFGDLFVDGKFGIFEFDAKRGV